jgi:hydrogenase nickel incorporation protein HypA/HybF
MARCGQITNRAFKEMHELSIAMSIVELAEEEAERRGVQVNAVHLKLGALSGVVKEALLSCYEMACENTPLQGSLLLVEDVPVMIFCPRCQDQRFLSSMQLFCCPECGSPTSEIVQGKELEVVALEIQECVPNPA